jgi:bifunctional UDP-N-acetylglucosamine pyrophosphorylase/glucosamine-1-phosphate N-acetyltransferase
MRFSINRTGPSMADRSCLTIILAAGEGTRMKSVLPKVLHRIAGLEMVAHVLRAARKAGSNDVALVVGHGGEAVRDSALAHAGEAEIFTQEERLGTAHAVLQARPAIERGYDDVLVLFGDTPLLEPEALAAIRAKLAGGADVVVMGFRTDRPDGYGRLVEKDGALAAIREEKDCSEEERRITFCNSGIMGLGGRKALALLDAVENRNAKGEFYLTDIVAIAREKGLAVGAIEASADNALGINNRAELAEAEEIWQQRRRRELMLSGVTLLAPETVFLSFDTEIGPDAVIEQNVIFGPGVSVAPGATVRAFSHLEGARLAAGAVVGPYARLRPGAEIAENAKIGNFVEIKKTVVGRGAKVPHLTYVGDAFIGAGANIGAGTITCNYDGFSKYVTRVEEGAFVGSNSSLVAPVTVGKDAYVASGSVITDDVPADALAFGRARQSTKEQLGKRLRERLAAAKKAR